jgi:5-methylcytosine-specific restriction protein A
MLDSIDNAPPRKPSSWTDAELSGAVRAYVGMLHAELKGVSYSKSAVNQELRDGLLTGRSKSSVEFRMQNISAALNELRMPIIQGYRPAQNVGSTIKKKMISLLWENGSDTLLDFVPTADASSLALKVTALREQNLLRVPVGALRPTTVTAMSTKFERDPAVKAWVLTESKGLCEGCGVSAPFVGLDGLPFLEVHHVVPLANQGSDRTTNAVALCPNCHRRCHYAIDRDMFKLSLYAKVPRLIAEVSVD